VFTVIPPAPTLTSMNPSGGVQGAAVPVTLRGSNFVAGAIVVVGNPRVAAGSVTVVSATQITATLTIAANAVPGTASVTVTTIRGDQQRRRVYGDSACARADVGESGVRPPGRERAGDLRGR
jgi:hypothetical protein